MVNQTNSAIKHDYVVKLSENSKSFPDVLMSTTNGAIASTIFLQGTLPRSAAVEARTTNGRVTLGVARDHSRHGVSVRARSTNGGITVYLPRDFDGLVALRTTNGKKRLSDVMTENAEIWPNEVDGDTRTITYNVHAPKKGGKGKKTQEHVDDTARLLDDKLKLDAKGADKLKKETAWGEEKEEGGEEAGDEWVENPGRDRAYLDTTNGSVLAQYDDEEAQEKEKTEGSCIVM